MSRGGFPGQTLRERREALGLTRQDVYARIRVSPEHVAALEAGELDAFPVQTYAAGFLQSYCRLLGLAPEPYLMALRNARHAEKPATEPTPRPVAKPAAPAARAQWERPAWLNDAVAWAAVCLVIALGWLAYSQIIDPLVERPENAVQAAPEPLAPPERFPDDDF